MWKKSKITTSTLVIGLVSMMICATNIVNAAPDVEPPPVDYGAPESRTVYDYPPEWGEMYLVFHSKAWVFPTYIKVEDERVTTNLVLSSTKYSTSGRVHYCKYSGMAPNWTQIDRTVSARY